MKLHFLGAHNSETNSAGLMCLLLDKTVALDAGSLTAKFSIEQQMALKAVLITHPHYDHFRDVPMLSMNLFLNGGSVKLYGVQAVYDTLCRHILNGSVYSDFFGKGVISFQALEPLKSIQLEGFEITPVPVRHSVPAVGFYVTQGGKSFFYTGDTGPGLAECWRSVAPELLIIEVTADNSYTGFCRESGHLTPALLMEELVSFRQIRGYLPRVLAVHMNPAMEARIAAELEEVADDLTCDVSLAKEGMEIEV
ncbi:MAG: MBL fold metallo-hydrolase [Dehalococcoidia bacterium]|nr:MBL fold metallo-hydrolase [Dehalococcoidia bacterium]